MKFIFNEILKKIELCFISYNTSGFGVLKQNYCKYLSSREVVGSKIPILCNQEHFAFKATPTSLNKHSQILINPAETSWD